MSSNGPEIKPLTSAHLQKRRLNRLKLTSTKKEDRPKIIQSWCSKVDCLVPFHLKDDKYICSYHPDDRKCDLTAN